MCRFRHEKCQRQADRTDAGVGCPTTRSTTNWWPDRMTAQSLHDRFLLAPRERYRQRCPVRSSLAMPCKCPQKFSTRCCVTGGVSIDDVPPSSFRRENRNRVLERCGQTEAWLPTMNLESPVSAWR